MYVHVLYLLYKCMVFLYTAPDIPRLLRLDPDRTSVNVTWKTQPYYKQDVQYLLEYREQGKHCPPCFR